MADAADSKSADRKVVKVRLLSPAPHSKRLTGFLRKPHFDALQFVTLPTRRSRAASSCEGAGWDSALVTEITATATRYTV